MHKQEWLKRSKNIYKRDKYGHIEGKADVQDQNPYDVLREEDKVEKKGKQKEKMEETPIATKEWVNQTFENKQPTQSEKKVEKGHLNVMHHKEGNEKGDKGEEDISTNTNISMEGAIVVYTGNNNETTPLAIQENSEPKDQEVRVVDGEKNGVKDKVDMTKAIELAST